MELSNEMKGKLIRKIQQVVHPAFIFLFGSFAKGTTHKESYVDLALIAGREVDLIDMKQIDTVFTLQIFAHGIPISIKDENEYIRQRMRAFSMYTTLNEQRQPIIEIVKKNGSVFGYE